MARKVTVIGARAGLVALLNGGSLLGLSAAAAVIVPSVSLAQSYQISRIAIEGNQRVSAATILSYLALRQGSAVSAGELNAAYQRVQNSGLFETVALDPQGGTLVVRVQEYPIVGQISIEGNRRLDDAALNELISSVPRRVYNPALVEQDARAIADSYEERGRLAAVVNPRIIRRDNNVVDVVFEVAEGAVTEVERISFVGNRSFSDSRLRRVLQSKQAGLLRQIIQSDTYIADRITLDRQLLTDFYQTRGFVDFRILNVSNEFSRDRNAFFTQFNLQEGQSYDFGRVTVSSDVPRLDVTDYRALARIRPGSTYSPREIDNAITRLERLATRRGLNFVRATPEITRDERNLLLNVDFRLERGPRIFVERIDIEGNQTTLDRVIRRQFDTVEGDPFNPREIRAAAERIRALGYFEDASVEAREGSAPDQVVVDVDVIEQPTGSLNFGGTYSTDSGVGVNIGYREDNFLGRGQQLAAQVNTASGSETVRLSFAEPAFLGRDLTFRFDAFYETTDFDEAAYNTRVVGFSPSISFPVSLNGRVALRYRLSEDTIFDVDRKSSPILKREEGGQFTSSVGYSYTYDTRIDGLDPNSGIKFSFGQDFAGLGGDTEYIKTTAELTGQKLVWNEEIALRGTLEGGAIHALGGDATRVTDRFFLNSRQLRGFEPLGVGPRDLIAPNEDALGGNYYVASRIEAEFPLGLPEEYGMTGGVFFDAGSVWGLDDTRGRKGQEVDDGFALRSAIGVSLFWDTPLGPLRFNFAEGIASEDYDRERSFNVTISTAF
ncbi:outer membrane protein assembly factor BamA [Palleronia sediminis]|uniref:Outer membrane protein assembly factor BamA n=1 Tax=Palleronia sediminis TaxID=2547833 RepID=A0A4R6ANN9_9RHOB|nr:outer membrane protein assembly factor BamA [Palleronia sediminis]TDL83556.1 outer membrane protein assembly factor BamA [Palleronia sediminis]